MREQEKRRTDVLRLRDICFRKNGIELKHSNPALEFGDSVSNTFERQKKDKRMDTVTHLASGDPILCPVRMWARVVRRIWSYPGADSLDVDDADPRPVHDRVPHVDRHHVGSSPDGARPVHEWIVYIMNFFTL